MISPIVLLAVAVVIWLAVGRRRINQAVANRKQAFSRYIERNPKAAQEVDVARACGWLGFGLALVGAALSLFGYGVGAVVSLSAGVMLIGWSNFVLGKHEIRAISDEDV